MRQLVILLFLGCASCASGSGPVAGGGGRGKAAAAAAPAPGDTLAGIRKLIGNAACADSSQCHGLAVGARACGGPEYYLAWSSANISGDQLNALGERYRAERQADNAASGRVSDCRYAMDPGAVCVAGRCQLRTDALVR